MEHERFLRLGAQFNTVVSLFAQGALFLVNHQQLFSTVLRF
jgi:hypothetical protein